MKTILEEKKLLKKYKLVFPNVLDLVPHTFTKYLSILLDVTINAIIASKILELSH